MDNHREELLSEALESSYEQSTQSPENFIPDQKEEPFLQASAEGRSVKGTQSPVEEVNPQMPVESELPVQVSVSLEMPLCEPVTDAVPVCCPTVPPNSYDQGAYGYSDNPYRGAAEQGASTPYGAFPPNPYAHSGAPYPQPDAPGGTGMYSNIPGGNYGQAYYYGQTPVQGYRLPPIPKKSRKGLSSMIFGILALTSAYFIPIVSCVLGIIALVFGVQTVKDKKAHEQERIFGIAGLVFGAMGILVSLVLTIVTFVKFFDLLSQIEGLGEHKPM